MGEKVEALHKLKTVNVAHKNIRVCDYKCM